MTSLGGEGAPLLALAVAVARIAAALALSPFLAREITPTLVRICLMMALAAWILELQGWRDLAGLDAPALAAALARETLVGLLLGFVFHGMLWAFLMAGQLIDEKIGATQWSGYDPSSGDQQSQFALLISRFGWAAFAAAGGLSVFAETLAASYRIWPLGAPGPSLDPLGAATASALFQSFVQAALMIAAPALAVLTLCEAALGLVNRAAPQLNAFTLSFAVKGWIAALIVLLTIASLAERVQADAVEAGLRSLANLRALAQ